MTTAVIPLSEASMLRIGLQLIGWDERRQAKVAVATNVDRFCSWFGPPPRACCALWHDLQTIDTGNDRLENPDLKYFLMTLHWLRVYNTLKIIGTVFKIHEDTVGKWVWLYAKAIQAFKSRKVSHHSSY